jgi:hypothetical protein
MIEQRPNGFKYVTASRDKGSETVLKTGEHVTERIEAATLQLRNVSGAKEFVGFDVLLGDKGLDVSASPSEADLTWQIQFSIPPDTSRVIEGAKINFPQGAILPRRKRIIFNNYSSLSTGSAGNVKGFFQAWITRHKL